MEAPNEAGWTCWWDCATVCCSSHWKGGQPAARVGPTDKVVDVSPNMPSIILAKRNHDDGVGVSCCKKLRASSNLHAMREAVRLTPGSSHPLSLQDPPSAPSIVQAFTPVVVPIPAPPPPPIVLVQEVSNALAAELSALAASSGPVMVPPSTITTSLLTANVATMSTLVVPPPLSLAPQVPSLTMLASVSPSTSFHPNVSLDHIYTSRDADSL